MDKIEAFKKLHEEFIRLVDRFPVNRRKEILFDKWNLQDVLIHLTAWNKRDALGFQLAFKDKIPIDLFIPDEDLDKFNAKVIAQAKNLTWDVIYNNFVKSGYELIESAKRLPVSKWTTTVDGAKKIPLTKDFEYSIEHYRDEHIPQLRNFFRS